MASTGIDVIKHTVDTSLTTHTFTHPSRGSKQFAVAVRGNLPSDDDELKITLSQRIPGRSSNSSDADAYDDEPLPLLGTANATGVERLVARTSLAGTYSGNVYYVAAGSGKQHVVNLFWPPCASDIVVTVEQVESGRLLAVTTWEVA